MRIQIAALLCASVVASAACGGNGGGGSADHEPPAPGGALAISVDGFDYNSVSLSWVAATDDETTATDLLYLAYSSSSAAMNTLADVEANGDPVGTFSTAITERQVTGLRGDTAYYFNVVVKDLAGNKAIYAAASATTEPFPIFVFASDPITVPFTKAETNVACSSKKAVAFPALDCTEITSLVTFSASEIVDLPTSASLPTDRPFVGPGGAAFGNDFADILDNSISISLSEAGIVNGSFFTGTVSDGTFADGILNCNDWTDTGFTSPATGNPASTGVWLANGTPTSCAGAHSMLCACWEP